MKATINKGRQSSFKTAFRDAIAHGASTKDALSAALPRGEDSKKDVPGMKAVYESIESKFKLDMKFPPYTKSTRDEEEPVAGAREVLNSILELHAKATEHLEGHEGHEGGHGGEHSAHGQQHASTAHGNVHGAAGAHSPARSRRAHNVHGAGTPPPAPRAPKAPTVAASVSPKVPAIPKAATPKAAAPAPSTTAPKAVAPKAPKAPKAPAASAPKATTPPAPKAPVPRSMSPKVTAKTKDSIVYHKDAAKRFRATVRDAVRENMPLPKLIEMGVISGTSSVEKTPVSEGTEYKPPTADAFRRTFRDAVKKGVSTVDAFKAALARDDDPPGVKRDEGGKFTGTALGKGGKELHMSSGHPSHEAAAKAALAAKPNAKSISTGHGYNGSFGIQSHRPDQVRNYK